MSGTGQIAGSRLGFGARPALVAVDFMRAYVTEGSPFFAPGVVAAVAESAELLAAARRAGVPIVHTNVRYDPAGRSGGMFVRKIPALRLLVDGEPLAEFCPAVAPQGAELVVTKQYASAFFGTSLASLLTAEGVDTVLMIGCSTSGCIRASAIDAISYGFRPMVIRECVGDRAPSPHEANLVDIDAKYGDVVSKAEALDYLARLPRPPAG